MSCPELHLVLELVDIRQEARHDARPFLPAATAGWSLNAFIGPFVASHTGASPFAAAMVPRSIIGMVDDMPGLVVPGVRQEKFFVAERLGGDWGGAVHSRNQVT
jgi:hypothetical protein